MSMTCVRRALVPAIISASVVTPARPRAIAEIALDHGNQLFITQHATLEVLVSSMCMAKCHYCFV